MVPILNLTLFRTLKEILVTVLTYEWLLPPNA